MSIYHHDDLDDFVTQRQADEAYPWGDVEPADWDEVWATEVIEKLLDDTLKKDI